MDWKDINGGRCLNSTGDVATIQGFECIFQNLLQVATTLAGIALFIMLLVGGFKYMTSGGDPKGSEQAKGTMTSAILGILVLIGAWLILKFLTEFTGIDLTIFKIPG
jgi:hypothetical protein